MQVIMTCGYFPYQINVFPYQFKDMKIDAEVKPASALNSHQVSQFCCVMRDDPMID